MKYWQIILTESTVVHIWCSTLFLTFVFSPALQLPCLVPLGDFCHTKSKHLVLTYKYYRERKTETDTQRKKKRDRETPHQIHAHSVTQKLRTMMSTVYNLSVRRKQYTAVIRKKRQWKINRLLTTQFNKKWTDCSPHSLISTVVHLHYLKCLFFK